MILNEKIKSKSSYYKSKTMFFSFLEECFSKHNLEINIKKYDINKEDFNGLSVCIPCFNDSESVENSIKSVLIDDVKNIYVMLMTDTNENLVNIKEHLESLDNRIKCFISEKKIPAVARNELFKNVTTSHVLFLDADDYLKDGSLKILIEESKTQDADCAVFPHQTTSFHSKAVNRLTMQTTCIMQSSFFRISGGFDERYKHGGEDPGLYFNKKIKIIDSSILIRENNRNGFGYHSYLSNCYLDIIKFNKNIFYDYFKNFINYEDITNFEYCQTRNIIRYLDYDNLTDSTALYAVENDEYCRILLTAFFDDLIWEDYCNIVYINLVNKIKTPETKISSFSKGDGKLSIIIPCWKNSSTIINCASSCNIKNIDSILVLLMDKESINLSEEIKKINPEKIKTFIHTRLSLPEARNFLINEVNTEWMTSIDGDEELDKNFINEFVNLDKKHNVYFTSNNSQLVKEHFSEIKDSVMFYEDSPHMFIKTELAKKELYDENTYNGFEDYELNLRLINNEKCMYIKNRIMKEYAAKENGMFDTSKKSNAIMYIIWKYKKLYSEYGIYQKFFQKRK